MRRWEKTIDFICWKCLKNILFFEWTELFIPDISKAPRFFAFHVKIRTLKHKHLAKNQWSMSILFSISNHATKYWIKNNLSISVMSWYTNTEINSQQKRHLYRCSSNVALERKQKNAFVWECSSGQKRVCALTKSGK